MAERLLESEMGSSWWTRPAGGQEVLRVAAPLIVSTMSWTVMTYADRIMLSWYSGTAMAAAFSANIVWFAVLCFPLGVCSYANTFVAQYHGSGQPERIGLVIWQAIWIALGFTPLVLVTVLFAPQIFGWGGHSPESTQYEIDYFHIITYASPAMLIAQSAAAFFSGRGKTWIVMLVDTSADLLNVVLDYLMIFGYGGFPEMGIQGAAWGTTIGLWVRVAIYIVLLLLPHHQRAFGTLRELRFDLELVRRMLRFGGPSGMQMLLDVLGFTVFIMLLGRLGPLPAEASSMAFSVSMLAFMPIYGLGMAVMVIVGQKLGEDRDDLAARSTYTALWMAYGYMLCISAMYLLVPRLFLFGFQLDPAAMTAEEQAVQEMAINLLRFVAAYNLFDATFMIFVNAIKGAGDTKFIFRVSLMLATLLAVFSYLAVEVWKLSVYGCWLLVVAWIWIAAVTFFFRFRQGSWRSMRVIEGHGSDVLGTDSSGPATATTAE
jgi:MATE family multidrug resistance protein